MLKIKNGGNHTLIKVNSIRLDINNANVLKSQLVALNKAHVKNIILDVSSCIYCDSSGLRAILIANRLCEDAIGTFILTGLQPGVEHLIKISMLQKILLITKTVDEAEILLRNKENL